MAVMESRGVPGVYIATVEFEQAAHGQAEALGADPPSVFVSHPVQDRSDEEMQEMARLAVDQVVKGISS